MKSQGLKSLLRKGMVDTVLQGAATTGVRFALILAIPILSAFLSPEEVARFDLFIIASNALLIFVSVGVDSGLGVVGNARTERRRRGYLVAALIFVVVCALCMLPFVMVGGKIASSAIDLGSSDLFLAYSYALCNALMLVIFSYYRWLSRAVVASTLVLAGNLVGFGVGLVALYLTGSLESLMVGLTAGSLLGSGLCLGFVYFFELRTELRASVRLGRQSILRLMKVSLPYAVASIMLLSRRFLDRAILLTGGSLVILGSYATVSRSAELIAFAFALPSIGLSPIIVQLASSSNGQRLARLVLAGYVMATVLVTLIALVVWLRFGAEFFPTEARTLAPAFLAVLTGSFLFGQTNLTSYGFIITGKTAEVGWLALGFIVTYALVALPFVLGGDLVRAVGIGFVVSSLIYSLASIFLSERRIHMGYPKGTYAVINSAVGLVGIWPLITTLA